MTFATGTPASTVSGCRPLLMKTTAEKKAKWQNLEFVMSMWQMFIPGIFSHFLPSLLPLKSRQGFTICSISPAFWKLTSVWNKKLTWWMKWWMRMNEKRPNMPRNYLNGLERVWGHHDCVGGEDGDHPIRSKIGCHRIWSQLGDHATPVNKYVISNLIAVTAPSSFITFQW